MGSRLIRAIVPAPLLLALWLCQLIPGSALGSPHAAQRGLERRRALGATETRFLVAAPTTNTTSTTTSTVPPVPTWNDPVTPAQRAAWEKVNACEEHGNWHVQGVVFSGGLGISERNWIAYGGQQDFGAEWAASEDEQIVVAMRMQPEAPDQAGCAAW